jgi:hypothetical protein
MSDRRPRLQLVLLGLALQLYLLLRMSHSWLPVPTCHLVASLQTYNMEGRQLIVPLVAALTNT